MLMFFFLDHQAQPLFRGPPQAACLHFFGTAFGNVPVSQARFRGQSPALGRSLFLGATTGRMSPLFRDSIRQRSGVSGPVQGAEPRFGAQPLFRDSIRQRSGVSGPGRGQSPALGRSLFFRGQPSAQHRCFERRGGRRELSASCRTKPGSFSLPLSFGRVGNPPQRKPV